MKKQQKYIPYRKESVVKIDFNPKSEEEKDHLRVMRELLSQKRRGDWKLVAEMIGTSSQMAEKSFVRVYSEKHLDAVSALDRVIESRRNLLKNK